MKPIPSRLSTAPRLKGGQNARIGIRSFLGREGEHFLAGIAVQVLQRLRRVAELFEQLVLQCVVELDQPLFVEKVEPRS